MPPTTLKKNWTVKITVLNVTAEELEAAIDTFAGAIQKFLGLYIWIAREKVSKVVLENMEADNVHPS